MTDNPTMSGKYVGLEILEQRNWQEEIQLLDGIPQLIKLNLREEVTQITAEDNILHEGLFGQETGIRLANSQ